MGFEGTKNVRNLGLKLLGTGLRIKGLGFEGFEGFGVQLVRDE